jgi:hypothetical protein
MDIEKSIEKNELEIMELEKELKPIHNTRIVLVQRILDEQNLVNGGLGDKKLLKRFKSELSGLDEKEEDLNSNILAKKKENEQFNIDIKRNLTLDNALDYYTGVKKFCDWKIKQLKRSKDDSNIIDEHVPEKIVRMITDNKNTPMLRRAFPSNIKV